MKFHRFLFFTSLFICGLLLLGLGQTQHGHAFEDSDTKTSEKPIIILPMKGAIGPALSDYMIKGIEKAKNENAALIVIELDTPGGLLTTTRIMTQNIIESPIPIAVYVTPAGAHAASAGTFIMYAAHVAAMTEGTNVGAATPIQMRGHIHGNIIQYASNQSDKKNEGASEQDSSEQDVPDESTEDLLKKALQKLGQEGNDDLRKKAVEDTSAFIRGLAELRGRNADWAVKSVTEASSITAKEALDKNVINILANSRSSLLKQIDGMTVKMSGDKQLTIQTAHAPVIEFPPDWKTQFLVIITNPNLALILMSIGVYGLILEFYNPGAMVPGVIGAISLTLGLYATNILPINTAGVILVLLGLVFMLAEFFIPSFGIMGFGGFAAFIGGLTILFETESMPGLELDAGIIWGIGILGAFVIGLVVWLAYSAQTEKTSTGTESMIGENATVLFWDGCEGKVRVQGEDWAAISDKDMDLSKGDEVTVQSVNRLKVKISAS